MLHPDAIKEFFDRPRDSHVWLKAVPEQELRRELDRLGFKEVAEPPLGKHQMVSALLGLAYPRFAFWLDMGAGKTRLVLELLRYFMARKQIMLALVLVPSEQAVATWEAENIKWKTGLPMLGLGNSASAEKWDELREFDNGVVVATYPGLGWMLSKRAAEPKKRSKQKPDNKIIDALAARLQAVVADESTKLGNHGSLTFRVVRRLTQSVPFYYSLAGRPFGRDPTMLWSQQYLVDQGDSLGDTLGLFRAALFNETRGHFKMYDYSFKKEMEPVLATMMQHRAISYSAAECVSLPPVTRICEEIPLPQNAKDYYYKAVEGLRTAKGDSVIVNNLFLRMRQISSGFLGYKDDETGERAQMTFPTNPKLERLVELVENVPLDRKFVICHEFIYSGKLIMEELKRRGIAVGWLWSGTKDSRAVLAQFAEDKKMRGLLVNHRVGAMSLNLQAANYNFIYESPVSVIDREQWERRTFRQGQQWPGFLYDLVAKGTMDKRILEFHASGESLLKALLRDPYKVIK